MSIATDSTRIQGPAGSIDVFIARPSFPGPWPALVIGHEGIGVNDHLRGLARRFAGEGYFTVIPDLYSRDEVRRSLDESEAASAFALARAADPEAAINALPEERRPAARRVLAWFRERDTSNYLPDFLAAVSWVKQQPETRAGAVGAIGFSFGGGLVGRLAAAGAGLAAGVIFYGPVPSVPDAKRIRIPLLGHFAAEDANITPHVPAFAAALASRGVAFPHVIHEGTAHGFFNESRASHHPDAAARAWVSTLEFLKNNLKDTVPDEVPRAYAIRPAGHVAAEGLVLSDLVIPEPGPGQVRVRSEFAGVNYIDIYQRSGAYPNPVETPIPLGVEGAGVIEKAGPGVEDFEPGDRIAWIGTPGSYASHVLVDAAKAIPLPDDIDTETGAALALQGLTAHALAFSVFPIRPGNKALIHAAAGGVGLLLVQLVKSAGAVVIATVSTEAKAELARKAGANHVILYESQDFAAEARRLTDGQGVDVVYDSVGKSTFAGSLESLAVRGFLILYGQSSGSVPPIDPQVLAKGSFTLSRFSIRNYTRNRVEFLQRAYDLFARVRAGKLAVRINRTLPLAEAASAHRALEGRETAGKLLLSIAGAAA